MWRSVEETNNSPYELNEPMSLWVKYYWVFQVLYVSYPHWGILWAPLGAAVFKFVGQVS